MLRPLSSVRRRVEQLAHHAASAACSGEHQHIRWVDVYGDEVDATVGRAQV